jgi:hypothetical protein
MLLRLLHRIIEILLHFERRLEQPFLRPALNYALRESLARLFTALINLQRSRENVGLAEETPQPGEEEDVQTMIDEMRRHLVRDFPPGCGVSSRRPRPTLAGCVFPAPVLMSSPISTTSAL